MANSKISALDPVITLNPTDLIPIVQGDGTKVTRKVRIDQLPQYAGKIDTTVADLRTMVDNNQLKPGSFYAFDFTTKYVIPNTESTQYLKGEIGIGWTERILVMALSENSLAPEAYSMDYPEDILSIDIFDDVCEDDDTPRDGKITYRKDTVRNLETWYDFRNVRFRRWQLDLSQISAWAASTNYQVNKLIKYNYAIYKCKVAHLSQSSIDYLNWEKIFHIDYFFMSSWDKQLTFSNTEIPVKEDSFYDYLTFDSNSMRNIQIMPTRDGSYNNIVIHETVSGDIHIGYNSKKMTISSYSNANTIGSDCEEIILTSANNNTIGNGCKKIQLYGSGHNSIGGACENLIIYGAFNSIGAFCRSIKLQYSQFNHIDSDCLNIQIGGNSNSNTFGPTCSHINLVGHNGSGNYVGNQFGPKCSNITLMGDCNVFQSDCQAIKVNGIATNSFFVAGLKNKTFNSIEMSRFLVCDEAVVSFNENITMVNIDKRIGSVETLRYCYSSLEKVGGVYSLQWNEINSTSI